MTKDDTTRNPSDLIDEEKQESVTERSEERSREDAQYVPVILKRTDEARRHPDDILEVAIEQGCEQLQRSALSLALSSITAGLTLGFTAMAVGVTTVAVQSVDAEILRRFATALVYPLGFVVCLMSGAELFTEHTATAVYPVLDRRSSIGKLLRLWLIVAVGNLIGTSLSAGLLHAADDVIKASEGYVAVAQHLIGVPTMPLLVSALLGGWLMAFGAWLILATPPAFSQIVCIYIVTFLIGVGGLHHSIAGSAEVFVGYSFSDDIPFGEAVRFIALALVGNICGGSLFVAVLNYAHIRESQAVNPEEGDE